MRQCFLLALLVASSCGGDDLLDFPYNSSAYQWVGEGITSGCLATKMIAQVEVSCALPERVTVSVDSGGEGVQVVCEDSTYTCTHIQQVKPYITNYTHTHAPKTVRYLTLDSCQPPQPLSCVLDIIDGNGVTRLTVKHLDVHLTEGHFDGLGNVTAVVFLYAAPNVTIPYTALSTLKALQYLKFTGGIIQPMHKALKSLQKIEIAESAIPKVDRNLFKGSTGLVQVSLWGNSVGVVEGDAFDDLPHLQNVSLNSNGLTHLPHTIFTNTPHITYLDLYNNDFSVIQTDTFKGLQEVREILLFGNRIPLKLEDSVFANLPTLTNLDLHENDLTELPPHIFTNSTNIQKIDLSYNKLATLNPVFTGINLNNLDLSHNLLQVLPTNLFQDQTKLEILDLSYNNLTELPSGLFSTLNSLNVLRVTDNKLGYLDGGAFLGLSNLKELYLDNNKLKMLQTNTFDLVNNLRVLSISHNYLTFTPPTPSGYSNLDHQSPLSSLSDLVKLDLDHNLISNICEDWRSVMVYLKYLDLSYNRIDEVTDIDLSFIGSATVDLRHNNITTIRLTDTTYLTDTIYRTDTTDTPLEILLDNNPYNCDCSLYTLLKYMKNNPKNSRLILGNAQCVKPNDLSGNKLANLSPNKLVCEYKRCPQNCSCFVRPATLKYEIYCNKSLDKLTDLLPDLPDELKNAELSLKKSTDLSYLPSYVTLVNLTGLNLTDAPKVNIATTIDLSNNNLTQAPIELLKNSCSLYLSKNPFKCDCSYKNSLQILRQYKNNILDYGLIACDNSEVISSKNIDSICVLRYAIIAISSLALLTIISITLILSYYKNRVVIRIILRKLGFTIADVLPEDIKYDAFISYAHQDENIVTNKILPNLEGRKKLKLCIHTRDWLVGDWIPEQIARSIDQSRCTIIVLSKDFVESIWGSLEFRTAHTKGRIVILVVDDVYQKTNLDSDLKAYLTLNTYIKLDDPLVWERLNDAILVHGKNKSLKEVSEKIAPVLLNVKLNKDGKLVNTAPGV
ncbi:protein toll-like [Colias croceus]|uniref:protein toll-like n=1 Tax=Colias crocea TaxID=72248 RepID=UPI001E27E7B0|nr:protein toll-like [Colias croceus]XP_045508972.1 protein toll-like [Colias croceus]